MPVALFPLQETNRSILERVYYQITQDILSSISVYYKTATIMFKDHEIAKTDNTNNATLEQKENLPSTVSKRKVIVHISEEYNEDELSPTSTTQQNAFPIYVDNDIDTSVYPIYVTTDTTIEFTYYTASKAEATRIRDEIRVRLSQTRNINIHDIEYSYILPSQVEDFIADIYDLKQRFTGETLQDYFLSHSTKRAHIMTDMSNPQSAKIGIYEKQIRIVGTFDFITPEKVDNEFDDNQYKVSFNYKLSINTPKAIVIRYPVMIGNKLVPYKYLDFIVKDKTQSKQEMDRDINYLTYSMYSLSIFEGQRFLENRYNIRRPMNVPFFDDFHKRVGHKGYGFATSFLVQVDETDNQTLLNLRDLGDYYINENILQLLLQGEKDKVVNPYNSIMYLGLHQSDRYLDYPGLTITDDLTVKSVNSLNLLQPVRVTLSIIIDLSYLLDGTLMRIYNTNKKAFIILMNEVVLMIRDYKLEYSVYGCDLDVLYRILLELFYQILKLSDKETVCSILSGLRIDKYIYTGFLSFAASNYPTVYKSIASACSLTTNDTTGVKTTLQIDISTPIMKTVMTDYIVAYRQPDQGGQDNVYTTT